MFPKMFWCFIILKCFANVILDYFDCLIVVKVTIYNL